MKILFVTDLYNIDNNSDSKALNNFVREWKTQGHEVVVIRPNFLLNTLIRHKKISKEKIFYENDIKVLNLNFITPFWFKIKNKLPNDFKIEDFDILISHMPSGALFAKKLLKNKKIPFCISTHMSDIEVLTSPLYSIYFKSELLKAYKSADFISSRSEVLKKKIEAVIQNKKVFVASSGIKTECISDEEALKKKARDFKNSKKVTITTVAKLIKRKNIDIVLKSLSQIKNFDFEYNIIGEGKEKKRLEKLAAELKIKDKVNFLGKLKHEQVLKELEKSNIFVMPSKNETFGLAYLEAGAKGNIVIGSKNDGIDGIFKDKINGFFIEQDSTKLTQLLIEIYNSKEEEISKLLINTRNFLLHNTQTISAKNYINNLII